MNERVAAARLRDLESVTDAALSHLPLEGLLSELLQRVVAILNADTAAVLLLEDDGRTLVARAARGLEEEVERGVRIPVGRGFAGRVAEGGKPIILDELEHAEILNPLLRERGLRSLLGVPLVYEGSVIGVMHVGTTRDRTFDERDVDLMERAGDRAALAIQGRIAERERGLADAMQRALIPALPLIPGVSMAARYLPAAEAKLGGDWYDAFLLPSGRLALVIGDVVGRGFHAAALMGQLRSGLRAYALEEESPGRVLERLSYLLRQFEERTTATVLFLVADPYSGKVCLASAGHSPPLIVADGRASFPEIPGSVPLGAVRAPRYDEVDLTLAPGSLLVLYTDGLVEPDGDLELGLQQLTAAALAAPEDIEHFGDALIDALLPGGAASDDAAMLAVRPEGLGNPLALQLPARKESVPLMRRALTHWLAHHGVPRADIDEIALACSEAYANSAEHAYAPGDAAIALEAALSEDRTVSIAVRDKGNWRPPRGTNRGRGLQLMEAMMDSVDVERRDDGTTVRMTRALNREGAIR